MECDVFSDLGKLNYVLNCIENVMDIFVKLYFLIF